jgi:hypothetical protein
MVVKLVRKILSKAIWSDKIKSTQIEIRLIYILLNEHTPDCYRSNLFAFPYTGYMPPGGIPQVRWL